jgi:rhodanese-related sulfurtransferase
MGGTVSAGALASMMFDTWTKKLSNLPDNVGIFPAHGAGSLCGAHLSDDPTSTLGVQRTANSYLRHQNRGDFVAAVLEGLPEAPQYFKHNAVMNQKGPELVNWQAEPRKKRPEKALTDPKRFYVVDVRAAKDYATGHLPNSVNIAVRGRLETWVGTMVPWGAKLVLCGSPPEVKEAAQRLHRVGYKAEALTPGDWQEAGLPLAKNELISPPDLYARMQTRESPVVVDVRLPNEWMGLRIGMVVNLPLTHLSELAPTKLDPGQKVVTVCNSAFRSSLAVGLLERLGFTRLASLDGGSEAWAAAGLPTFGPEGKTATASLTPPAVTAAPAPKQDLKLPERISPASLQRLILDLPNSFDLVDLRPAEAFADYHLDGSRHADIGDVIQNSTYLTGAVPLILVDRDGSLAMAVGGILSQKTSRPIKVLHGGLAAYWAETELKAAGRETPKSGPPQIGVKPAPTTPAPAVPSPAPPSTPPATPKKKSAGC